MPEDIVTLSRRIARLRPVDDAEAAAWWGEADSLTGLPCYLGPFYIREVHGPNYAPTGIWSVCTNVKGPSEAVIETGFAGLFTAYRRMVDCFEAWQLVKPIERVYFIGTELERGALIKVGYSRDPAARLRALQTSHGEKLRIFATVEGGKDLEQKYHRRWKLRRREGEWFTIGDCIIAEIERLTPPETNHAD